MLCICCAVYVSLFENDKSIRLLINQPVHQPSLNFAGECLCQEGLGGCDCSDYLNQPPLLQGILDSGLCDELELPCSAAYIFGHFFTDNENLICKLSRFEVLIHSVHVKRNIFICIFSSKIKYC